MADDQQLPPTPLGITGSFPPSATPPTVPWTERPIFSVLHAPRPRADDEGRWPGRRVLTRTERVLSCAGAVLLAGYFALVVVESWREHTALAVVTAAFAAAGVGALAASAWARRPRRTLVRGWPLGRLPRLTRRALVGELRSGHLGPAELRPYAVDWVCQSLQAPWTPALMLLVIANYTGTISARPDSPATWQLVVLVVLVAVAAPALTVWARRRRAAHRVADALDHLPAPPPRGPGSQ